MTKDDIELLYEYDRWANDKVLQASSTLSTEQFIRDLGGSFSSFRDTLVHIFAGEWEWLQYWNEPSPNTAFLADLTARRKVLFDPSTYPDLRAVRRKWMEVREEQVEFLRLLTNEGLERLVAVRATQIKLVHLMQHVG
jgi:uncharacterized damage-inducible protein DinB